MRLLSSCTPMDGGMRTPASLTVTPHVMKSTISQKGLTMPRRDGDDIDGSFERSEPTCVNVTARARGRLHAGMVTAHLHGGFPLSPRTRQDRGWPNALDTRGI